MAIPQGQYKPLFERLEKRLADCMLADRRRLGRRLGRLRRRPVVAGLEQLERQVVASTALYRRRVEQLPAITYPEQLPIAVRREEICRAIAAHPVVIVAGETGSGKTTQLPKMCLEVGRGRAAKIAVTQPRRVAALSLSRRLAEELGVEWGRQVGCKIRFDDRTTPETYIKMVTDGMLLAEIQTDPDLLEYDTVIIDEAHERSLNIDFLLGYLRLLRRRRPDLKIIVTSATIDTESFSQAFDGAPVIQVSGRLFPVEVRHWPLETLLEGGEDFSYVDGAAVAVERLVDESPGGDVLVFMPGERDIRETRELLAARLKRVEVLPLFGRLTAAEQQRVFAPQGQRRVVIATNIAETSLTIPNIRYVVDTGLTRLSRYNPRNQTRSLPIEAIAQSSAAQRQGRCGRVQNGICVRLYSEEDFLARPEHTPPEIQRADLAEVILRMHYLKLGDPETFPFVDPPRSQAIKAGYQLLEELGAIDGGRRLTPLGRDLARLPIAPRVARMVLEAKQQQSLAEVLVIAAGISVQDPRERPLDKQEEADRQHRQFIDAHSDFITLHNIWQAYHTQFEGLGSQSQLRKFCRAHFLSYMRIREWRDLHTQLRQTLAQLKGFELNREAADYAAVHRAVVSGLLNNAARKKEHNLYQGARGGEVMLFPGSGLFQRQGKDGAPQWVVAAEQVETSRLFARTVARVEPEWLLDLGRHLCRSSYRDPHWDLEAGRVLVRETVRLYGLVLAERKVGYNRINAKEATEIFIREALMGDQLRTSHAFLAHNRQVRAKIEAWQTRLRRRVGVDVDQVCYDFYAERLDNVSSVHDLNRFVRQTIDRQPRTLFMEEKDLLGELAAEYDGSAFPDALEVDGQQLPLRYAFSPGQEEDGLTVRVPYKLVHAIEAEVLEWLVPGLLEEKIVCLLRSLPKAQRKRFVPVPDSARQIAAQLRPTHTSFLAALEEFIRRHYGVLIQRDHWQLEQLPDHLRMRVEVEGEAGKAVAAGRDLAALGAGLERRGAEVELDTWKQVAAAWQRQGITQWDFGELPAQVEVGKMGGVPVFAYPGLEAGEKCAEIKLFRRREEAEPSTRQGLKLLLTLALKDQLAFLRRDLRELGEYRDLYRHLCAPAQLQAEAFEHLTRYLFDRPHLHPLNQARFEADQQQARQRLRGLSQRFIDQVVNLLTLVRQIRLCTHPYPTINEDLGRLMPKSFLLEIPHERLAHVQRYLRAVLLRAERARINPGKDKQKAAQVRPYEQRLQALGSGATAAPLAVEQFRWALEEYRVSLFAQELGTAQPVSAKRLDQQLAVIEGL